MLVALFCFSVVLMRVGKVLVLGTCTNVRINPTMRRSTSIAYPDGAPAPVGARRHDRCLLIISCLLLSLLKGRHGIHVTCLGALRTGGEPLVRQGVGEKPSRDVSVRHVLPCLAEAEHTQIRLDPPRYVQLRSDTLLYY